MSEAPPSNARNVHFRPVMESVPSTIGLRRLRSNVPFTSSTTTIPESQEPTEPPEPEPTQQPPTTGGRNLEGHRRRSQSAPQRLAVDPQLLSQEPTRNRMPSVSETVSHGGVASGSTSAQPTNAVRPPVRPLPPSAAEYDPRIVDMLDVIDPEVSTLSSITNIQNSLFVPSLGRFINRRPTYDLDRIPRPIEDESSGSEPAAESDAEARPEGDTALHRPPSRLAPSLRSTLEGANYAVLPHGVSLEGWTDQEVAELNDHVRHMLHSKRSKFKRSMKAFGKYVRKPLGFLVTLYATLITLFGLAWVLFLIGWIYVGTKQLYVINVIDYVLVALFAVVGDGMAPFRAVDTYHMIFIAHYHRLTWKLRKQKSLPKLQNKNDLPTQPVVTTEEAHPDLEAGVDEPQTDEQLQAEEQRELSVLTPKQQATLVHHQTKFARSHTFYKPHETETHHAFPLNYLVAIVVLLDLHSCLQISLGACTWGIDYHVRPMGVTATILTCSITVNILAGVVISLGGRRTRKKDVVERMFRQELTEEALREMRDESKHEKDKVRKIDEALDEADENKPEHKEDGTLNILKGANHGSNDDGDGDDGDNDENKEKTGMDFRDLAHLPRRSLDVWREKRSGSNHGRSPSGKKPVREAGRFDISPSLGSPKTRRSEELPRTENTVGEEETERSS